MSIEERFEIRDKFLVPTWPAPNSARIDPAYRWVISTPDCVPRASRYFFNGAPEGIDIGEVGIIDMFPTGPMRMNGQTPINSDGRQVFLECLGFQPPDLGPQGFPGMYVIFLWTRVGFTPTRATYWSPLPQLPFPYHDMGPSQTNRFSPISNRWDTQIDQLGENPDFTANWLTNFGWKTISACNLDLPGTPQAPLSFAEFNGVDAYISLDHNTVITGSAHFLEADIRIHAGVWVPILGREASTSIWGLQDDIGRYSIQSFADLPIPPVETWFRYREEFEWSDGMQLNYRIFIDDVEVFNQVSTRTFVFWKNLGVLRRTLFPEWGNFDLKNLLYKTGTFASPVTTLDMPLTVNALDLGPDENHGTTFNMDLPST